MLGADKKLKFGHLPHPVLLTYHARKDCARGALNHRISPAIGETWLRFDGANSASYGARRLALHAALVPFNTRTMIRAFRPDVVVSFLKGMSVATYCALFGFGAGRPRWIAREGNNAIAVIDDEITCPAGRHLMKALMARVYRAADVFLAISHGMAMALPAILASSHRASA
jgi:hypothetical protein